MVLNPLQKNEITLDEIYAAIRIRCARDFELFCTIFFGEYTKYPYNKFHKDCFEDYSKGRVVNFSCDGAPRGYAKSTVKVLFKPIHDICYGLEKYILFISATEPQAVQKLKDIRREIFNNEFLCDVYGISFNTKKVGAQSFEVTSDSGQCLLQAVGAGTEMRGFRYGAYRPTKIILDDVEDSEEVQNEELRNKLEDWFKEVVSKLGSNDTIIEVVGTVLHKDSLLKRLGKNPAFRSRIYKSVISWAEDTKLWEEWKSIYQNIENDKRAEDAAKFFEEHKEKMLKGSEVLWPEKEPYDYLMRELVETGRRAFMKEKQNDPIGSEDSLFDTIWWYREDEKRQGIVIERTGVFIPYNDLYSYGAIDPATGVSKGKNIDFTCIVGGYKDLRGRLFLHRDFTRKAKPSEYIKHIFDFNDLMKFDKFVVEENLFRSLLLENIVREKRAIEIDRKAQGNKDWSIKVNFYEILNRDKKDKRIFTLEPKVNNGWILFNRALSEEFVNQFLDFPKADHDDAPDAVEMLWGLVNNRYKPSPLDINVMGSV